MLRWLQVAAAVVMAKVAAAVVMAKVAAGVAMATVAAAVAMATVAAGVGMATVTAAVAMATVTAAVINKILPTNHILVVVKYCYSHYQKLALFCTLQYNCMKPKAHCTFLGSVVSLLTGVEKKAWLISHCRDRANRRPSWLLAFTMLCPLRASRPNLTYY